jgi:hypothetical protein
MKYTGWCQNDFNVKGYRHLAGVSGVHGLHRIEQVAALQHLSPGGKVKFTGLTQNPQVDPAVLLKLPIRALELTQILGQPCEFQVRRPTEHHKRTAVYSGT